MEVVLVADWVAPSIARNRVRRWLTAHRWSPTHQEELVLAVSEAVSNSVEHGYGVFADDIPTFQSGIIEIHGKLVINLDGVPRVEFTIRDHGRWRLFDLCGRRGYGMTIMRACTDEVVIDRTPDGTTIMLRSRPLPRSPLRPI
jgi:anti-sigma regulatory factor (Ser/Thr protein kinase)